MDWNLANDRDFFWGQICSTNLCSINGRNTYEADSPPVFRIQGDIWIRQIAPRCRLLAEPIFWWLITISNLVIAACLSFMAWFHRSAPLVTIGDAIDSFLTEPPPPDSKTIPRSSCTYHHASFTNVFRPPLPPRAYSPKATPMWKSVSLTRWSLTMVWFLYLLSQCVLFFAKALVEENASTHKSIKSFFAFNFDSSIDSEHTLYQISSSDDVDIVPRRWRLVLIANTPQVFLSLTYLFFNNILTKMVAEREWHSFYVRGGDQNKMKKEKTKRWIHLPTTLRSKEKEKETPTPNPNPKTLRTSHPRGLQRSTFFLSLPYRYALPFVLVSSVMHWLMSQCLYFTEVDFVELDGFSLNKSNPTTSTLGYSTWALFWVIVLGTFSWTAILGMALLGKYPAGMPVMGGCSGVVAAACFGPWGRRRKRRPVGDGGNGEGGGAGDAEGAEGTGGWDGSRDGERGGGGHGDCDGDRERYGGEEREEEGGEEEEEEEAEEEEEEEREEEREEEEDIAAGPLSWGVIRQVVVKDGVEVEEKWLGFTRGEAEIPVVGEVYG